jgi:hypothetical protein
VALCQTDMPFNANKMMQQQGVDRKAFCLQIVGAILASHWLEEYFCSLQLHAEGRNQKVLR